MRPSLASTTAPAPGCRCSSNPYTGKVLGTDEPGSGPIGLANRLHGYLNNDSILISLPTVSALWDDGADDARLRAGRPGAGAPRRVDARVGVLRSVPVVAAPVAIKGGEGERAQVGGSPREVRARSLARPARSLRRRAARARSWSPSSPGSRGAPIGGRTSPRSPTRSRPTRGPTRHRARWANAAISTGWATRSIGTPATFPSPPATQPLPTARHRRRSAWTASPRSPRRRA